MEHIFEKEYMTKYSPSNQTNQVTVVSQWIYGVTYFVQASLEE